MLLAGDEFGRTQKGNNNAYYCLDRETIELAGLELYRKRQVTDRVRQETN